jgi:hypothetical protein
MDRSAKAIDIARKSYAKGVFIVDHERIADLNRGEGASKQDNCRCRHR